MAYRLSRRAKDDIVAVYVQGAKTFGDRQADTYHDRLQRSFEMLSDNPRMGRERSEVVPPVRVQPCGSHVIVYVIEPDGDVLVVRVRHGNEDWSSDPIGVAG